MTFKFPKHPNEMNPNELFDMVQQVQQQAKSQGQHYPISTTRHPAPGTEATVNDMHVGATRQQLTDIFNRQKSTPPIAPAQPTQNNQTAGLVDALVPSANADDRLAQNVFTRAGKGGNQANEVLDMAHTANDVLNAAKQKEFDDIKELAQQAPQREEFLNTLRKKHARGEFINNMETLEKAVNQGLEYESLPPQDRARIQKERDQRK